MAKISAENFLHIELVISCGLLRRNNKQLVPVNYHVHACLLYYSYTHFEVTFIRVAGQLYLTGSCACKMNTT